MSSTTMASANQRTETFFERHAWTVFFGLGIITALFGLSDILTGAATQGITGITWQELGTASPVALNIIEGQARLSGAQVFIMGLFIMVIALTGLRRGERWVWYTMWLCPLLIAFVVLLLFFAYNHPGPGITASMFFVVTVLTLALSYHKHFPERQKDGAEIQSGKASS